jgi:hypothetical protein
VRPHPMSRPALWSEDLRGKPLDHPQLGPASTTGKARSTLSCCSGCGVSTR